MGEGSRGKAWRAATVLAAAAVAAGSTAVFANAGGNGHHGDDDQVSLGTLGVPTVILYDGKISTVDKRNSTVEAIALRDGEIMATGSTKSVKKLAQRGTKLIDLNGRRVLPGLIDGHIHGMREGYHCWTQVVRLDLVTSRATALGMYKAKADQLPDGRWIWTTSGGWNLNQLDDPTVFTYDELNTAAPNNPVWIQGSGITGSRVNQGRTDRGRSHRDLAGRHARAGRQADGRRHRSRDHDDQRRDPGPARPAGHRRRGQVPAGLHRRGQQPWPDGLEGRRRQHRAVEHDRRHQRRARTSRRAPWRSTATRASTPASRSTR